MASFMQAVESGRERGTFCTLEIHCQHLYSRIQILLMQFFILLYVSFIVVYSDCYRRQGILNISDA